jgi:hypothetical protein
MIFVTEARRKRVHVGTSGETCGLCGRRELPVVRSQRVRRGLDLVHPRFDLALRFYTLCPGCGARRDLDDGSALPR